MIFPNQTSPFALRKGEDGEDKITEWALSHNRELSEGVDN